MLLGDVQKDVSYPSADEDNRVLPLRPRRQAVDLLPVYARELDEMRNAFAQLSADYVAAVETASALRETLLRASVRNQRSARDERHERDAASLLRRQLEATRRRVTSLDDEIVERDALIAAQTVELSARQARIIELQQHLGAAVDRHGAQATLIRDYDARLVAQADWARGLEAELKSVAIRRSRGNWLLRIMPAARPACTPQRS
jgi:chromosome segregation ATPase